MATRSNRNLQINDVSVGGQSVSPSDEHREYNESREVVDVPDTFPCGHVLCHHCIRRYVSRYRASAWCCPVCNKEFGQIYTKDQPNSTAGEYASDYKGDVVSMTANFDEIVAKFNGINQHLPILKKEHVTSRSVGLSHTNCPCDMCDEDHGILSVVQEYNRLEVEPQRHQYARPYYFWRRPIESVVTTYHSKINSSCVCVPCTYKEIQENPEQFYALTENNNIPDLKPGQPKMPMAEVGKLLTREVTPVKALHGKNVIEFEHKFRLTDRADRFDFQHTTDNIKSVIQQSEKDLVMMARKCINDTGNLYHVQERKSVDFHTGETVV